MIVQFRPAAAQELVEATQWYLDDGGRPVAERFEWTVRRAVQLVALMPRLGTPSHRGTRVWPLKHFPYSLVYRMQGEVLSIVAVAHHRRAPTYWQGR